MIEAQNVAAAAAKVQMNFQNQQNLAAGAKVTTIDQSGNEEFQKPNRQFDYSLLVAATANQNQE
jgi:hypothetical protein